MKFSPEQMEEEEEEQNVLGERDINNNRVFQEWRTHFGTKKWRKIKMEKSCCYQIPVWNKWKKKEEEEEKRREEIKIPAPKEGMANYIHSFFSFFLHMSVCREYRKKKKRILYVWRYFFLQGRRETRCLYDICYHPPNVLHTHTFWSFIHKELRSGVEYERKKNGWMLVCVSPFYNFFSYFLASRLCRSSTWTANTKQKDELRVDKKKEKEKMIQHNWNVALRYVFYWKEKASHFIIVIWLFLVFFFFSFQVREKNRKVIITVMILPRTLAVVFFYFFFETLNFGHFAFYDGAILKYKNKLKKKKSGKENWRLFVNFLIFYRFLFCFFSFLLTNWGLSQFSTLPSLLYTQRRRYTSTSLFFLFSHPSRKKKKMKKNEMFIMKNFSGSMCLCVCKENRRKI